MQRMRLGSIQERLSWFRNSVSSKNVSAFPGRQLDVRHSEFEMKRHDCRLCFELP